MLWLILNSLVTSQIICLSKTFGSLAFAAATVQPSLKTLSLQLQPLTSQTLILFAITTESDDAIGLPAPFDNGFELTLLLLTLRFTSKSIVLFKLNSSLLQLFFFFLIL